MSLPAAVEASRAQRVQRQQARYRDRGGIFRPADHNPLLDLLLARGVNGESPSPTNSPPTSPSRSASPRRKRPSSHPQHPPTTRPARALKVPAKNRPSSKPTFTAPERTADDPHNDLHDMSDPGPSIPAHPPPTRNSRASKSANKSRRQSSSVRPEPPPHPSDDESLPVALSNHTRARDNAPKSTREKPSKPRQPRNRKLPSHNPLLTSHIETVTDHAGPANPSRIRAQKKAKPSKSKIAVVAKLATESEDPNPAPAPLRPKPSRRTVQSLESDSEQPCIPKKSAKGKLRATSLEKGNHSSQGGGITAQKTTNRKTNGGVNSQSDVKEATLETCAQVSTSLGTKRKKLPSASSNLPSAGRNVHLELNADKHSPQSRSSSPESPAKEPARKRRKARQTVDNDDDKVTEEQEPQMQNRRPSRQTGNASDLKDRRKVSRSKAPPIPMPNGVRLKPKPRPRLSMFQPPPDDDTSDRDPIDFLS